MRHWFPRLLLADSELLVFHLSCRAEGLRGGSTVAPQTPHADPYVRQERQDSRALGRRPRPRSEPPGPSRRPRWLHQVVDAERPHRRQAHEPRPRPLSRRHRHGSRAGPRERLRPAAGRDPRRGSPRDVPTFAQVLETVIAIHAENWKDRSSSEHQWRASLATYAFPRIGTKRLDR